MTEVGVPPPELYGKASVRRSEFDYIWYGFIWAPGMPQVRRILSTEPIAYQRESRWDQLTLTLGPIELKPLYVAAKKKKTVLAVILLL